MPDRRVDKKFVFVLIGAFILRVWGIGFGLYHADEPVIVNHALAYASFDFNPRFFNVPPLVSYLLFVMYGLFYIIGRLAGVFPDVEAFQILFVREPVVFYVLARFMFGVLLGTATVALLYRLAKRFFNESAARWSALILAVNFLHARDSHYIYVDIPMVFAVVAAVYCALEFFEKGTLRTAIFCGIGIGVATALKYNAAVVVVPFLVAIACRGWFPHGHARPVPKGDASIAGFSLVRVAPRENTRDSRVADLGINLLACLGSSKLIFILLNPFAVLDWRTFTAQLFHQAGAESAVGFGHHFFYSLIGSAGIGGILLAFIGIFFIMRQDRGKGLVLFSFPIVFYLSLVLFSQHHERYALPIVPFLCLGAGVACQRFLANVRNAFERAVVWALLLAAAVIFPLGKTVKADILFSRADTRDEAKVWIEKNLQPGSKIAFDHSFYRPLLTRTQVQWQSIIEASGNPASRVKNEIQKRYADPQSPVFQLYFLEPDESRPASSIRPLLPFDNGRLRGEGIDVVVVHHGVTPEHRAFYEKLKTEAKLLRRISPYKGEAKERSLDKFSLTAAAYSWREIFSRKRWGPVLEIWSLRETK